MQGGLLSKQANANATLVANRAVRSAVQMIAVAQSAILDAIARRQAQETTFQFQKPVETNEYEHTEVDNFLEQQHQEGANPKGDVALQPRVVVTVEDNGNAGTLLVTEVAVAAPKKKKQKTARCQTRLTVVGSNKDKETFGMSKEAKARYIRNYLCAKEAGAQDSTPERKVEYTGFDGGPHYGTFDRSVCSKTKKGSWELKGQPVLRFLYPSLDSPIAFKAECINAADDLARHTLYGRGSGKYKAHFFKIIDSFPADKCHMTGMSWPESKLLPAHKARGLPRWDEHNTDCEWGDGGGCADSTLLGCYACNGIAHHSCILKEPSAWHIGHSGCSGISMWVCDGCAADVQD